MYALEPERKSAPGLIGCRPACPFLRVIVSIGSRGSGPREITRLRHLWFEKAKKEVSFYINTEPAILMAALLLAAWVARDSPATG